MPTKYRWRRASKMASCVPCIACVGSVHDHMHCETGMHTKNGKIWIQQVNANHPCTVDIRRHGGINNVLVQMFKHCSSSRLEAVPSRLSMALQTLTYSIWFASLILCPLNSLSCQCRAFCSVTQQVASVTQQVGTLSFHQQCSNVQVGWQLQGVLGEICLSVEGLACSRTAKTIAAAHNFLCSQEVQQ